MVCLFKSASIARPEGATGLSFSSSFTTGSRTTVDHARPASLSQLVSSRAYRQVEFLGRGILHIFKPSQDSTQQPSLAPHPIYALEEVFDNCHHYQSEAADEVPQVRPDYESSPQLETGVACRCTITGGKNSRWMQSCKRTSLPSPFLPAIRN